jgi:hypothetical protein
MSPTAAPTQAPKPAEVTVLDLMDRLPQWFKGESWAVWRICLSAMFNLPMSEAEQAIYTRHTGRATRPTEAARETWILCGRRAGKTLAAALTSLWCAAFRSYRGILVPGERGLLMCIGPDRRQARVALRYLDAFFQHVPGLAALVERRTQEAIHLRTGISIEVHTASFRSTRGYTIVAFVGDEVCFWRDESSANPDTEILNAIRPAQATVPGAVRLCISSPYARRGEAWRAYSAHWGREGDPILVWNSDTLTMNPTVPEAIVREAFEADPDVAASEYGQGGLVRFRADVETFVSREVLEASVVPGRIVVPPISTERYAAFADPAGGSGADSFTWAIAHSEQREKRRVVVLDAVEERRPPFSPEQTVQECAGHLAVYGVSSIVGDRYAGSWPAEQFAKQRVTYEASERVKSDIYRDALPLLTSGLVELLDHPKLAAQLQQLERRTARGGRDSIDHGPNGHDDLANSACGALLLAASGVHAEPVRLWGCGDWADREDED